MKVGDRTLGTYEVSGVHQNVQGDATTDMGMRCLGIYDDADKAREEHGACTFTDSDGDKIMATYERKNAEGGIETLVAGTGKFAGISGTGEWTVLKFPLKSDDKLARGIRKRKSPLENHLEYDACRRSRTVTPEVSDHPPLEIRVRRPRAPRWRWARPAG